MHLNSSLLFKKYALGFLNNNSRILEVGPAGNPSAYKRLADNPNLIWHTIDFSESVFIEGANNALTYQITDPYRYPVESDSYDVVLSGQVIEHIEDVWKWVIELKRIVKPGGYIITINPVSWPYHEAPIDCWRIFPMGIKNIAERSDLEIVLNTFESLEESIIKEKFPAQNCLPGRSFNYVNSERKIKFIINWNRLINFSSFLRNYFHIPLEVSYDTISVLRKSL